MGKSAYRVTKALSFGAATVGVALAWVCPWGSFRHGTPWRHRLSRVAFIVCAQQSWGSDMATTTGSPGWRVLSSHDIRACLAWAGRWV